MYFSHFADYFETAALVASSASRMVAGVNNGPLVSGRESNNIYQKCLVNAGFDRSAAHSRAAVHKIRHQHFSARLSSY